MAQADDAVKPPALQSVNAALYRAMFQATPHPMLLLAVDAPRFTMLAVNDAHLRAFQTTEEGLVGHGLFEVFPAEPDPMTANFMEAVRASLDRCLETGAPDEMAEQAFTVFGPDGADERYLGATQTPILGADGRVAQILSTVRDATVGVRERRANEARALLMREVDHRARNALTVVQSVVKLTDADDIKTFKGVVLGRVEVLGRAQTSLARRRWEGGDLRELVEAELGALVPQGRYRAQGPPVVLPADHVQATSMVLHELVTNATKYGALSTPDGHVDVSWTLSGGRLHLTWSEAGGPSITAPTRTGFGSRLVRQLAVQIGGEAAFEWRPAGLRVEVTAAL